MIRRLPALLGLAAVLTASACSGSAPERAAAPAPAPATTAPAATAAPTTPPVTPPPPSPSATPSPTTSTPSYDVRAVQAQLTALKYYGGAVDGEAGGGTRSAVMAFQKVNGLGADGTVGPKTLAALEAPTAPTLKGGPADRVEVDLTTQVLYVVSGGELERIMPVSSGNGERYAQKSSSRRATALTPVGTFTVERRIVGVREADLGTLYDPQYFYRGWAIHGSNSVPATPASHGCVRVSRADAKYLLDAIDVGTTVTLYGGEHTFPAGSAAPGTDSPTGDEAGAATPATTPVPTPAPTPGPVAKPSPTPSTTPTASTTPSAPSPTPVP